MLLFTTILLGSFDFGFAQCDKNVSLASSKTEYLDEHMTFLREVKEKTAIVIRSDKIVVHIGDEANALIGIVKPVSCSWSKPFSDGKSVFNAELKDKEGNQLHVVLTIEGKEGRVTLLGDIEEQPDMKIRLELDTFLEIKELL